MSGDTPTIRSRANPAKLSPAQSGALALRSGLNHLSRSAAKVRPVHASPTPPEPVPAEIAKTGAKKETVPLASAACDGGKRDSTEEPAEERQCHNGERR